MHRPRPDDDPSTFSSLPYRNFSYMCFSLLRRPSDKAETFLILIVQLSLCNDEVIGGAFWYFMLNQSRHHGISVNIRLIDLVRHNTQSVVEASCMLAPMFLADIYDGTDSSSVISK